MMAVMERCPVINESTIDSEGFKGGTRGSPIMPRDAVSRTANVESTIDSEGFKGEGHSLEF